MADLTITERIAEEIGSTGYFDRRAKLPTITSPVYTPDSILNSIKAIKAILDAREGTSGSVLDKSLTMRDLIDAGAIQVTVGGATLGLPGSGLSFSGAGTAGPPGETGEPGPPGLPGGGWADPRPYLATPPAIGSLTAVGTFRSVMLTWTMLEYLNHSRVEVYRAGTNSRGSASLIGTSLGNLYVDASAATGITYYYWARAVGVDTAGTTIYGPDNAVGGTAGGAGVINGVDIGPLVIEAGNLAGGAVTTAKFASNIEPITIITGALPTTFVTKQIFLTSDEKLYKWVGGVYSRTIPTVDLSGTIAGSQIALGAVDTLNIASGAVTAALTDIAAINPASGNLAIDSVTANTIKAGEVIAGKLATNSVVSGNIVAGQVKTVNLDAGNINANVLTAGSITTSLMTAGTISGDVIEVNTLDAGRILTGSITATQIKSDEIQARHLAANSIAVGTLAVENGALVNAMIGLLAVDTANIVDGAIETVKIGDAQIVDAHILNLSAGKITTGFLDAGRIAANSITAVMINSNGLSINTPGGLPLLVVGAGLLDSSFTGNVTGSVGGTSADTLVTLATTAAADAAEAKIDADNAQLALGEISSDSKLTTSEKQVVLREWSDASNEKSAISAQATSLGITTENTNYITKYYELSTYLNGGGEYVDSLIPPVWISYDFAITTTIVGSFFRTKWSNFYTARQTLLNKIAQVASERAAWANLSSRPTDAELLNVQGDFQAERVWNFNYSTEGWTNLNAVDLATNASTLMVTANGVDSNIRSPTINIYGPAFYKVRARIRRLAGSTWAGELYYTTGTHTYDGNYYKIIPAPVGSDWQVMEWDMSNLTAGGADWLNSTITSIRLDLGFAAGDNFEVDWIAIGSTSPGSWGAPAGSLVGSVGAETVAGAANAVNDGTTGLAYRMRSNADNILGGVLLANTVGVPVGMRVGTVTWDTAGTVTGGTGVAITPKGIYARNPSATTFTLDASTGNATFAGALAAASGTFAGSLTAVTGSLGALVINTGGYIRSGQGAYNSGTGFYIGTDSGTPRFSIGNPAGAHMRWDGTDLFINTPSFEAFSSSIPSGHLGASGAAGVYTYGSRSVSVSGGKPGYSYAWFLTGNANAWVSGVTGSTVTVAGIGNGGTNSGTVVCLVRDANGRSTFTSFTFSGTHAFDPGGGA